MVVVATTRTVSRVLLGISLSVLMLLGTVTGAQQHTLPAASAEELLHRIIKTYRSGDLAGSWDAFMAFLDHPSRNELHIDDFTACFYEKQCPQVGAIGRILDKPHDELARRIGGFCPQLTAPEIEAALRESDVAESDIAQYLDALQRTVSNGFNGSCSSFRQEQLDLMRYATEAAHLHVEALPLAHHEKKRGGAVPTVAVLVGDEPLQLVVDTGSSLGSLRQRSLGFPHSEVQISDRQTTSLGIFEYLTSTSARLTSLQVGRTRLRPFAIQVDFNEQIQHTDPDGILGMTFLLRHRAICFAWDEHRLYIGALGPCSQGVELHDVHLSGSLVPAVDVRAANGTWFTAYVDTAAWHTNCSAVFAKANHGEAAFSFGDDPALVADCLFDEAVLFKSADYGFPQIGIRMNDLLRFSAFGWQLNPFRMYFVPRHARADGSVLHE